MKVTVILSILVLLLGAFLLGVQDADAARLGGGRSFGSRPSMSQAAPSSTLNRQSTAQTSRPGAAATASRPGLFGGMGGMLGGLLAGSLIGSLLFGGGMGGGGGFLDLLLIALLAFLAFRFFAARRQAQTPAASPAGGAGAPQGMFRQGAQDNAWSRLQEEPAQTGAQWNGVQVPAGFDVEEFLRGAKMAYNRMQASWDARNLTDIAQFATDAVMEEVRRQFAEDPTPSKTEILMLDATLLGVESGAGEERAQVLFDANLREGSDGMASQVREVWHFVRRTSGDTMWRLDGIQQVES